MADSVLSPPSSVLIGYRVVNGIIYKDGTF